MAGDTENLVSNLIQVFILQILERINTSHLSTAVWCSREVLLKNLFVQNFEKCFVQNGLLSSIIIDCYRLL